MFITLLYPTTINGIPTDLNHEDQKRSFTPFFGRYSLDPDYFFNNQIYKNKMANGFAFHKKRQLKSKWTDFFQPSQTPYTIAFPALIRTRRWIKQDH